MSLGSNRTPERLLLPTVTLIVSVPGTLNIVKHLLHLLYGILVASVLAHVVTELDGRTAIRRSNLDDNIERLGLFSSNFVREIVCRK